SMALTEAQLFLGAIFYAENKPDSACLYLNSGIDLAPETMAHFYFMFFESAFKIEEYTYASHWLKSFEKLFGKIDDGLYEADFNYTVDDWERLKYSLDIIYDYNYWIPGSHIIDTLELGEYAGFSVTGDDI